jgi:Na+-transporting methylmalonyl-CoA/oxaloacetate decarboxylase gamma subunit
MVLETWLMPLIGLLAGGGGGGSALASLSPFRLLRLLRLTRMARLMRFVPEMMTLVKGIIAAGRSVGFIFLFLVMVIYVFAILFTSQLEDRKEYPLTEEGEEAQDLFATLGCSMMSLFTRGVLGDNLSETVQAILDKSVWLMWAFWVFFIITFATLLNMLIGVLCEVISSSAEDEAEQESVKSIRDDLETAFDELDEDSNGMVTNREWDQMKRHPKVFSKLCAIFEDRVDERLEQIEELFFGKDFVGVQADDGDKRPDNGLPLDDVIDQIIAMRPNQTASALDMEMLHRNVELDQDFVMKTLHNAEENLRRLLGPDAAERCPHKTLLVKKKSSEKFRTSASNRFGD